MEEYFIGHEIKKSAHLFKRELDSKFSVVLNANQRFILNYVIMSHKNKKDIFQKDIEKELNVRRSTATVMLQTLEKKGFIKRENVDYDARLKKIVPIFLPNNKEFKNTVKEVEKKAINGIDKKDLETFSNVLNQIQKNLEEDKDDKNI